MANETGGITVGELTVLLGASAEPLTAALAEATAQLAAFEGKAGALGAVALTAEGAGLQAALDEAAARLAAFQAAGAEGGAVPLTADGTELEAAVAAATANLAAFEAEAPLVLLGADGEPVAGALAEASAQLTAFGAEGEALGTVELSADGAGLAAALAEATARLAAFEDAGTEATEAVAGRFDALKVAVGSFAGSLAGALAAPLLIHAFHRLTEFFTEPIRSAAAQQDAVRKLDAALASLGPRAASVSLALQTYAGVLEETTKFSDDEAILAAARIGAYVKEESTIEGLTAAAADLAEVRGIGLVQAAEQIGRAVGTSGNALKRYGVEIQGVAGSAERAQSAIAAINAKFGGQAVAGAQTYTGVMKRLHNAVDNVREAIGDLVVRNGALLSVVTDHIIPAVQSFTTFLQNNRLEMQALVSRGLTGLIRGFGELIRAGAKLLTFLEGTVNAVRALRLAASGFELDDVKDALESAQAGVPKLEGDIVDLQAQIQRFQSGDTNFADAFSGGLEPAQEQLARTQNHLVELQAKIPALKKEFAGLSAEVSRNAESYNAGVPALSALAAGFESAAVTVDGFADAMKGAALADIAPVPTKPEVAPPATDEQVRGLESIKAKLREIEIERLRAVDPLAAEIALLDEELLAVGKLEVAKGKVAEKDALIAAIATKRTELVRRTAAAQEQILPLNARITEQLRALTKLDPEAAGEFARSVGERLKDAIGPEGQAQALAALSKELGDKLAEQSPKVGSVMASGIGQGIQAALTGSGNALQAFGASLAQVAQSALDTSFAEATRGLGVLLDKVFSSSVQGMGGLLTGIFGAVLGAAFNKTEVTSAASNIQSAVTSAQQVRGLVAGPSTIAIAQVGDSIRDAFKEPERLLGIIARNTGTLAAVRAAAASAALTAQGDAAFALAHEGASLV